MADKNVSVHVKFLVNVGLKPAGVLLPTLPAECQSIIINVVASTIFPIRLSRGKGPLLFVLLMYGNYS